MKHLSSLLSVWSFWFVVGLASLTNTFVSVGLLFYGDGWLIIQFHSVFGFHDWLGFILFSGPSFLASLFVLYVSVNKSPSGLGGGDES